MVLGVGITAFLLIMQRQFMWWQLHPIGYVMGAVYSSYFLWSCMFIGWFLKYLALKSGDSDTIGGIDRCLWDSLLVSLVSSGFGWWWGCLRV